MAILAIGAISLLSVALCFVFYDLFLRETRLLLRQSVERFAILSADEAIAEIGATRDRGIRWTLIDAGGIVRFDSAIDAKGMENHLNREEISAAFAIGRGESRRFSGSLKEETCYYAIRLKDGAVIRAAKTTSSIFGAFSKALPSAIGVLLALIGVVYFLAGRLAKKIVEPINSIDLRAPFQAPYKELGAFAATIGAQREQIERELAEKTRLMDLRREFSANVSHELKTPLTTIYGYAQMLDSGMVSKGDRQEFYAKIKDETARLITLVEDIMMISELDEGRRSEAFEPVDLRMIAQETINALAFKMEKNSISVNIEGEGVLQASRSMMFEMFYNLLDNAIKYNRPRGTVKVKIAPNGKYIVITITDSGIGIPKAAQSRIFERFYRVDKSRSKKTGGTGLGLAIVKHIALFHNGSIEVKSKEGEGTSIILVFKTES
jgi:two-component system phosphate regulon sensor histidine kinase PhoR